MYDTAPSWSPDSSRLAFVCTTSVNQKYNPDGSVTETRMECGGDGLRIVNGDGPTAEIVLPFGNDVPGYGAPSWSPDGSTLALSSHWSDGPCRGRVVFSLASRQITGCFELPPPGGMGGRCGGPEDVATDWSPDGSKLIYHWEFGAGRNGVFIIDVATGEERLVPFAPAWHVTVAPDGGHLAFAGTGHIWVAGLDGSGLTLLAEGNAPAWQPQP
jgi:Tol biopolymer transport system component